LKNLNDEGKIQKGLSRNVKKHQFSNTGYLKGEELLVNMKRGRDGKKGNQK